MKRISKALKSIFFPNIATVALVSILSALSLIYSLVRLTPFHRISLLSYILSAYSLSLLSCALLVRLKQSKRLNAKKDEIKRLRSDAQLRVTLALYGTFLYNAIYATFTLFLGLWHNSLWYLSIAAYYVLLAIMRFSLLGYSRSNKAGEDITAELKKFRSCGILLILMNTALAIVTAYSTWKNRDFSHHGATTTALALFTLSLFVLSIINIVKYKKLKSPVLFAAKLVSFTSALVSMLSLITALVARVGDGLSDWVRRTVTGVSTFTVLAIIGYVGIFMLVRGSKELKKLNK